MRRDLACRQVVELVTAYLEDELSARDRRRFEAHLAGARIARAYVEQMRVTLERVGTVSLEGLSPEAERELLAAFADWQGSGT